jgi:hypothetical protein
MTKPTPGLPVHCVDRGVLCDQDTASAATNLTFTGDGLKYNGVPLVVSPGSRTLVLSADPSCMEPAGDKFDFPVAPPPPGEALAGTAALQQATDERCRLPLAIEWFCTAVLRLSTSLSCLFRTCSAGY